MSINWISSKNLNVKTNLEHEYYPLLLTNKLNIAYSYVQYVASKFCLDLAACWALGKEFAGLKSSISFSQKLVILITFKKQSEEISEYCKFNPAFQEIIESHKIAVCEIDLAIRNTEIELLREHILSLKKEYQLLILIDGGGCKLTLLRKFKSLTDFGTVLMIYGSDYLSKRIEGFADNMLTIYRETHIHPNFNYKVTARSFYQEVEIDGIIHDNNQFLKADAIKGRSADSDLRQAR